MGQIANLQFLNQKKIRVSTRLLIDVPLIIVVFTLVIIGLIFVYSASWSFSIQAFDNAAYMVSKQAVWLFLGIAAALIMGFLIPYRWLQPLSPYLLIGTMISLLILLLIPAAAGVTRTFFGGSVQPSEIAKIAIIIYLAALYTKRAELVRTGGLRSLEPFIIPTICAMLVMVQPDFSAAITILALSAMIYMLAGGQINWVITILLVAFFLTIIAYFLFDKVRVRTDEYISGFLNPEEASYHIQRVLKSIINGGWFGTGVGKGIGKMTGLPVPWTDSIYVVIIEETGVTGGIIVLGLYLMILWRGFRISISAPDAFGKLLAAGITLWITFEALLNIGVLLNIFPFAGNALPLISYGGTNMVVTLGSIGILLNISRQTAIYNLEKGKTVPDAMVNLRGGDRGWRVSSLGRSPRTKK